MEPFTVTRLAYDGSDPSDTWVITAISHTPIDMEKVHIMDVNTISEYESGCQQHVNERCMGHLCRTPHGNILPMQSLAVTTGVVRNDVAKAAKFAFEGPSRYYATKSKDVLGDSMKKKTGRMRKGVLNCHVDGSLRQVLTPQTDLPIEWVAIPYYLADKWTVIYFDTRECKYKTRQPVHGDYAIAVRPPTLAKSLQPVRLTYWNETCIGISPYLIKEFDGDYDGDEMHIFPVYDETSIEECKSWIYNKNVAMGKANEIYGSSGIHDKSDSMYGFMEHTTLSFEEIRNGYEQPLMAEQTRTKKEHLDGFKARYDLESVSQGFIKESIRGMADTNAQQISQPIIGDMSRIAKIVASNVLHLEDKTIGIATTNSFDPICEFKHDTQEGSSAVRGLATICAGIQQIALESHHAKKKALSTHDMVTEMLTGGKETVIVLDSRFPASQIKSSIRSRWHAKVHDEHIVLADIRTIKSVPRRYIVGTYNTEVLSLFPENERLDMCSNGIEKVCSYYELPISETEVRCIAVLFSYRTDESTHPITTRDGATVRGLRWTEIAMATNYKSLISMAKGDSLDFVPTDTISSKLMTGNFCM